jgi:hypothetical protein
VIAHKIECFGHRRKKRFSSARVEAAHLQASNNACDASNPYFSIDDILTNSYEVWIALLLSKRREDVLSDFIFIEETLPDLGAARWSCPGVHADTRWASRCCRALATFWRKIIKFWRMAAPENKK